VIDKPAKTSFFVGALVLLSGPAWALPASISANATVDDAKVTLTVPNKAIDGDAKTRCTIRIEIQGREVPLSAGDKVTLKLYEDDLWPTPDEELWKTEFTVGAGEGVIDRTFDCSAALDGDADLGNGWELYGYALVEKDQCGLWCFNDDPSTPVLQVGYAQDDNWEDDSTPDKAHSAQFDRQPDRILRNHDWTRITLADRSRVKVQTFADLGAGAIDVLLFDGSITQIQAVVAQADNELVLDESLDAGVYYIRLAPRDQSNFNWYDLQIGLLAACDCGAGEEDIGDCELCGYRTRPCADGCRWGVWGPCQEQGVCEAGATEESGCGNCGKQVRQCQLDCSWGEPSLCTGEGECPKGALDETGEGCDDGGVKSRTCSEQCTWGEWSDCAACVENAEEGCYSGPDNTAGRGICKAGTRTCRGGVWGACSGEVLPGVEQCGDALDSDCDGKVDPAGGCGGETAELGDPCDGDADCGEGKVCLGDPSPAAFIDGTCSVSGCTSGSCGMKGACVQGWGGAYCLVRCDTDADCRASYYCAVGVNALKVCLPQCLSDKDCPNSARPSCATGSGRCQEPTGEGEGEGSEGEGEGGTVSECGQVGETLICYCTATQQGVKTCGADGKWSTCVCGGEGEGEGEGGEGEGAGEPAADAGGCACATAGTPRTWGSALLLLGLLGLGLGRRGRA